MVDERISRAIDNDHTAAMKITSDGRKLMRKKNGSSFASSGNVSSCSFCQKVFKNHLIYRKHLKLHSDKQYICQVCGKGFVHKHYLQSHMLVHGKTQHFQCTLCQKRFSQKGNLNQHLKFHASKKPFKCEICEKDFFQQEHLKAHLRHHNNERPFQCEVCNKSFNIKSSLQRHMNCHTGAKPFICDICNRGYTRRSVLMLHIQQVHENKKPFQCAECQLCFSQKGNLQAHFRRKHMQPKAESKKGKEKGKRGIRKHGFKQNSKTIKANSIKNVSSINSVEDGSPKTKLNKISDADYIPINGHSLKQELNSNEHLSTDEDIDDHSLASEMCIESSNAEDSSQCITINGTKLNTKSIENGELYNFLNNGNDALCNSSSRESFEMVFVPDSEPPNILDSEISVHEGIKTFSEFDMLLEDAKGWEDYLLTDPDILDHSMPHNDMGEMLYSPAKVNAMLSKSSMDIGDELFPNFSLALGHDYTCAPPLFGSDLLEDLRDIPSSCGKSTLVRASSQGKKKKKLMEDAGIKRKKLWFPRVKATEKL